MNKSIKKRQEILNEDNFWKLFLLYGNYFGALVVILLVLIIGCFVAHFAFNLIIPREIYIVTSIFIFLIVFLIFGIEIDKKHLEFQSSVNRKRFILFAFYFFAFNLAVTYYSLFQAREIKNDKSTFGVSVTLDNDQTIVSDSSNYFIGKTQNYIFIYNEKASTTDIIPMTRVKQISMKHEKDNKLFVKE